MTVQYMILLALLFIVQFSVSIAALAIGNNQQDSIAKSGWCSLPDNDKNDIQNAGACFGYLIPDPLQFNNTADPNYCMRPGSVCPTGIRC